MAKLNLSVPGHLKARIDRLALKFNLPQAEIVRLGLKSGLPLLEQVLEAEERLLAEIRLYRSQASNRQPG